MEIIRTAPVPAPLVPTLPDFADPEGRKRHQVTEPQPRDLLHFLADVYGPDGETLLFRKGSIVGLFGYCRHDDLNGMAYTVRVYLPGHGTTWAARDAYRYPTALQQEVCFGPVPELFTELDLTDHAEALALERHEGAKVIKMYPTPAHIQRRAA